jgi:hypothetical protein
MKSGFSRQSVALALVGVGIAFGAGVGFSAIPGTGGIISGCYDQKGVLRVIDADAGQTCGSKETPLTWNQAGQPGPTGPRGPSDAFVGDIPPLSPLLDGQTTSIFSMNVPAGSYVIQTTLRMRSQIIEGFSNASCDLYAGGQQLDIVLVQFPEDEDNTGQSATLVGWIELAAPSTVELFCRANHTHFLSTVGVDGGKVVATAVSSLTVTP